MISRMEESNIGSLQFIPTTCCSHSPTHSLQLCTIVQSNCGQPTCRTLLSLPQVTLPRVITLYLSKTSARQTSCISLAKPCYTREPHPSFFPLKKNPFNLILAYKIYVRPLLEYASPVWSPSQINLINTLEAVQRKFTKSIPGLSQLSDIGIL